MLVPAPMLIGPAEAATVLKNPQWNHIHSNLHVYRKPYMARPSCADPWHALLKVSTASAGLVYTNRSSSPDQGGQA